MTSSSPFEFDLPIGRVNNTGAATLENCKYWDTTSSKWSRVGCISKGISADAEGSYLRCSCLHLTDFGALSEQPVLPQANLVDPIGDAALLTKIAGDQIFAVAMMAGFLVVYLILMFVTSWIDRCYDFGGRSPLTPSDETPGASWSHPGCGS